MKLKFFRIGFEMVFHKWLLFLFAFGLSFRIGISQNWSIGLSAREAMSSVEYNPFGRLTIKNPNITQSLKSSRASFSFAIEFSRKINQHFFLISGLQYSQRNGGYFLEPGCFGYYKISSPLYKMSWIEIPLAIKHISKKGWFVKTGIQVSASFDNSDKFIRFNDQPDKTNNKIAYDLPLYGIGIHAESGYRFFRKKPIQVELGPSFYFTERFHRYGSIWSFGLKAAICFGIQKKKDNID